MSDLLALHGLTVSYGAVRAIDDLTLKVQAGARHAVIGPNGAGKSTLINAIAGTAKPSSGQVLFDGADISTWPAHRRARAGVGRTWQHAAVHEPLTVLDNVLTAVPGQPLGRPAHRPAALSAARQALAAVELADAARTRAGQLPYGQRRLLEIAIALAGRPRLLLLDEPSAGLSGADTARLAGLIRSLPAEVGVLLVDHNLPLVFDLATTVTVLHHGRHLTTGTPAQVRDHPQANTAYLAAGSHTPVSRPPAASSGAAVLVVRNLRAGYGGAPVLSDIDLDLHAGQVFAVIGRNGAGKTTLLDTIAGLHPTQPPTTIVLAGTPITARPTGHRVRAGLSAVPQGRHLFRTLTVEEHLTIARPPRHRPAAFSRTDLYELLPALAARRSHRPHQLSGGEQQMLAIARALLTGPRVLLLDEPSEGLAPRVIIQLADVLTRLADTGVAILLAEQNLTLALAAADQVTVLHNRSVVLRASAADLRADPAPVHDLLALADTPGTAPRAGHSDRVPAPAVAAAPCPTDLPRRASRPPT